MEIENETEVQEGTFEMGLNGKTVVMVVEAFSYLANQGVSYLLAGDRENFQPILNAIRPVLGAIQREVPEGVANIKFIGKVRAQVAQDVDSLKSILSDPIENNKSKAVSAITAGQTGGSSFIVTELTGTEKYVIQENEVNTLIRQSHEVQKIKAAEYLRSRINEVKNGEIFVVDNNILREAVLAGVFASFLPDATLEQEEAQGLLKSLDINISMLSANLFRNFTSTEEEAKRFIEENKSAQEVIEGTKEFVSFMINKWEALPEDKKQNGIFAKLNQSKYFSDPKNAGDLQTIRFLLFEAAVGSTVLNTINAIDLAGKVDYFNLPIEEIDNRTLLYVAAFFDEPVDLTFRQRKKDGMPIIMHLQAAADRFLKSMNISRPKIWDDVKKVYAALKANDVDGLPWFRFQGMANRVMAKLNLKNKSEIIYFLRNCSGEVGAINIGSGILDELRELEFVSSRRVGDLNSATSGGRFKHKFRVRREA